MPQAKLCKTPLNSSDVNDTNKCEVERLGIGDKKMAKEPRDSRRKNGLITSRCILIDIYKREYEVRRKVNIKSLNEG